MAFKKMQILCYLTVVLVSCHVTLLSAAKKETAALNLKPSSILLITTNRTTTEKPNPPNRSGRVMKIFYKDPKDLRISTKPKYYGSPPTRILSRSDHYPPHLVFQRRPFGGGGGGGGGAPRLQMIRRVHNNLPTIRQNYDNFKSSRYSPIKDAALGGGFGPQYRPQFGSNIAYNRPDGQAPSQIHQHPNSLSQGGVVGGGGGGGGGGGVPSQQYVQNFKASPVFSGKAIVRPVVGDQQAQQQQQQHEQYLQQQQQYTQQQQQQKYQQARDQYYTQEQLKQQLNQREYFDTQQGQPQQSNNYQINLPLFSKTGPKNSYSVYEEPDLSERAHLQIASAHNQDLTAKEAQEYLNFMGTNEYFLPKREPNYRKIDEEREQRAKYQQQQLQQLQQRSQYPQTQQQQQQRQIKYSKSAYDPVSSSSSSIQTTAYSTPPIEASQLFYHADSSPSSAIVRGSYQAGNNVFVVNSDGNKAIKHIVPNPLATTPRTVSSTQRYNLPLNRTPEPIRFEFTERDAISPATYTNSPTSQSRKGALVGGSGSYLHSTPGTPTSSSTTPSLHHYNALKQNNENRGNANNDDDPEDEEDMQEASSSDIFGRVPVVKVSGKDKSEEPPSEQKDTEDYCEKICSNVQDDDEEVVCGSDGYMYTSEAQMECYASCLHIDVTIQGKGSCSAR